MVSKKDLRKYYKEIRKELTCSFRVKCEFISELKCSVKEYIHSNLDVEINDIINHFGTPNEIASNFSDINIKKLMRKANIRLAIIIILCILLFIATWIIIEFATSPNSHIEVTTTGKVEI